uniref:Uncharacterized protein n=1 Tax=Mastacembelus armatus TaxID=205130 RepID=A0A7N9AQQ4_9TELE
HEREGPMRFQGRQGHCHATTLLLLMCWFLCTCLMPFCTYLHLFLQEKCSFSLNTNVYFLFFYVTVTVKLCSGSKFQPITVVCEHQEKTGCDDLWEFSFSLIVDRNRDRERKHLQ